MRIKGHERKQEKKSESNKGAKDRFTILIYDKQASAVMDTLIFSSLHKRNCAEPLGTHEEGKRM
jgi:hypothetical protein